MDGELQSLEYKLIENGNYDCYRRMLASAVVRNCGKSFSNIRCMLALANSFNQLEGNEQYLFIGGAGVLGNVLRHVNESKIFDCRYIHDLDLVLRSRNYQDILTNFFDGKNTIRISLSIPGKLTVAGNCIDSENRKLEELDLDVYIPTNNPREGASVNGVYFDYHKWESRKVTELLGISFNVASPLVLLSLKLNIKSGRRSLRRTKDCQDIVNLIGILERDGCEPNEVYNDLSCEQYNKLRKIFNCDSNGCGECRECKAYSNPGLLVIPNQEYIDKLIKCGEDDEDENLSVI